MSKQSLFIIAPSFITNIITSDAEVFCKLLEGREKMHGTVDESLGIINEFSRLAFFHKY